MTEFDKRDIVTINLKYGSSLKPLKVLAFAQLAAKTLYLCKKPLKIADLAKEVANLIGIKNISEEFITQGLDYLREINKVIVKNDEWILREEARVEIAKDLDHSRVQIKGVLKRHFLTTIEERKLKDWFKEASAYFFGYYGDEWVSAISKKVDGRTFLKGKTVDELLLPSIKNHKLEALKQPLIGGFIHFLSSEDNLDQQYLMFISQAMFSARLVAADVGVDPITLEELKNAKFLLDTNVLFSIALESSILTKSINSLEDALKNINASIVYLYTTKEEYGRALSGNRDQVLHLASIYSNEVLKDVANDFVATAKIRKCNTKDDYERFFISLVNVPKEFPNGYPIKMEDDKEIEKIRKMAEDDKVLKNKIQKYTLKFRARWRGPKSEKALNHDSAILHVAEFIKKEGSKCWVLSLDKSLQSCAINNAGPHGIPILLSVSALIEILAINNAGPEFDSTNFAPLLSKIILNECMPPLNTYLIQDLIALHKINEKAAELPTEDVKDLVKEVTKARIEGKTIDSTALQLKVNRMYHESTLHLSEKLENARARAEDAEEKLKNDRLRTKNKEILNKVGEIKRKALFWLIGRIIIGLLVITMAVSVMFFVYKMFFLSDSKKNVVVYLLSALAYILPALGLLPKAFSDYKESCDKAKELERTIE